MPIQLNPFQRPHFQRHFIQILGESLYLGSLEQTNDFQVIAHEPGRMFGQFGDHAFTNVVRVARDLHVPEDCSSVGFLLAHLWCGVK